MHITYTEPFLIFKGNKEIDDSSDCKKDYTNNVCKKMNGFKLPEYKMKQLIEKGIGDCSYSCLIRVKKIPPAKTEGIFHLELSIVWVFQFTISAYCDA